MTSIPYTAPHGGMLAAQRAGASQGDCIVHWAPGWAEKMGERPAEENPHRHIWTSTDGRARCSMCGERPPKLVLNLRCEWCKQLFEWQPRSAEMIGRMVVRRTCGPRCRAALQVYEFSKMQGMA